MTVRFVTLGCRVNQVESQALAKLFAAAGWSVVPSGAADVVVVNSCTVTAEADRKTRQALHRERRHAAGLPCERSLARKARRHRTVP